MVEEIVKQLLAQRDQLPDNTLVYGRPAPPPQSATYRKIWRITEGFDDSVSDDAEPDDNNLLDRLANALRRREPNLTNADTIIDDDTLIAAWTKDRVSINIRIDLPKRVS